MPESGGPYRITFESGNGSVLFDLSFDMTEFVYSEGGGFTLFFQYRLTGRRVSTRSRFPDLEGVASQDSEGDRTVALLLDTFTGQVRGLLHEWVVPSGSGPPARRVLSEPGL